MSHPVMFDDADPLLARVRSLALALPGAAEKISHGRPFFYTKTSFAVFGGTVKGSGIARPRSVIVKPDPSERDALVQDVRAYTPAYLGPSGWVGIDLGGEVDWAEIAELLDMSYRVTAPARLVRELDARAPRR